MLRALSIRDVLIIDRLDLAFQPGLNVLTGETGAGKSILLDALGFVLGWRGRAELVRSGAAQGEVVAEFDLPPGHAARAVLVEAGLAAEDELILRRVNYADGRKTAFVNDRRASAEVLRDLSDTLVELHGQQDDRGLLNPRGHRALLDSFAGLDLGSLHLAWRARAAARNALAEAEALVASARAEEDFLRHAVAELDKLSPEPGEDAVLDIKRRRMQGSARISKDIARAHAALTGAAEAAMLDAQRWLETAADQAEGGLDAPLAALARAQLELADAQSGVETVLQSLDFNPGELEALEERLFAIRAMARKHSVLPDDLGGHLAGMKARLDALDSGAKGLKDLMKAVVDTQSEFTRLSLDASQARRAAAKALDAAMARELAPLKMERAVFTTEFSASDPGPDGVDQVTFTVATNPGAPAGALNKIASGGELSRFLLALKVCLTGQTPGLTMIFDEIDRGVGGATADAVGRRLQQLSGDGQVLVVTHSPQVAALGAHHWRVEKRVEGQQTLSTVTPLSDPDRVEEIARMLAGDTITDAARQAARSLLGQS
ncbi:MAG: DNA repair protein RecN [Candidatus Saccharibacteria bacterium]|nr:DNA repair protein RecN [Pseudorhodobacter sp.]